MFRTNKSSFISGFTSNNTTEIEVDLPIRHIHLACRFISLLQLQVQLDILAVHRLRGSKSYVNEQAHKAPLYHDVRKSASSLWMKNSWSRDYKGMCNDVTVIFHELKHKREAALDFQRKPLQSGVGREGRRDEVEIWWKFILRYKCIRAWGDHR